MLTNNYAKLFICLVVTIIVLCARYYFEKNNVIQRFPLLDDVGGEIVESVTTLSAISSSSTFSTIDFGNLSTSATGDLTSKQENELIYDNEVTNQIRDQVVEKLKEALIQQYLIPTSLKMKEGTKNLFLEYSCPNGTGCRGFGDRVQGVVSCFYLAFASRRIFNINWIGKSLSLEEFFNINSCFYNVSSDEYMASLIAANNTHKSLNYLTHDLNTQYLSWCLESQDLINDKFGIISLVTNSFLGMKGAFGRPEFNNTFQKLTEEFQEKPMGKMLYASAALRIVFGNPTERLNEVFQNCIVSAIGSSRWDESIKIGVQLRTNGKVKINPQQHWHCFAKKPLEIVDKLGRKQSFVVFITSDDLNAGISVKNMITKENVKAFSSWDVCSHMKPVHIDKTYNGNANYIWKYAVNPYVDWLTLTKMDYLVITHSSYSEMASLYSLKPTYRLNQTLSSSSDCVFQEFIKEI